MSHEIVFTPDAITEARQFIQTVNEGGNPNGSYERGIALIVQFIGLPDAAIAGIKDRLAKVKKIDANVPVSTKWNGFLGVISEQLVRIDSHTFSGRVAKSLMTNPRGHFNQFIDRWVDLQFTKQLQKDNPLTPLIYALALKQAADSAAVQVIVNWLEANIRPRCNTMITTNSIEDYLFRVLQRAEPYRRFSGAAEKTIKNYAIQIYGSDSDSILGFWNRLILLTSKVDNILSNDGDIQRCKDGLTALVKRDWEQAGTLLGQTTGIN